MHPTWSEAASWLNAHYEAFREQHGRFPAVIYAPAGLVAAWLDFPVNVIPCGDKQFRGAVLRVRKTGTAISSPLT